MTYEALLKSPIYAQYVTKRHGRMRTAILYLVAFAIWAVPAIVLRFVLTEEERAEPLYLVVLAALLVPAVLVLLFDRFFGAGSTDRGTRYVDPLFGTALLLWFREKGFDPAKYAQNGVLAVRCVFFNAGKRITCFELGEGESAVRFDYTPWLSAREQSVVWAHLFVLAEWLRRCGTQYYEVRADWVERTPFGTEQAYEPRYLIKRGRRTLCFRTVASDCKRALKFAKKLGIKEVISS